MSRALHLDGVPAKPAGAGRAAGSTRPAVAPVPVVPTLDPSPLDRLYELAPRLRRAWSAETSLLSAAWSADWPAFGQSAATACVLQDLLGGDILESRLVMADGFAYSHFANIVDGLVIDLAQAEAERAAAVVVASGDHADFPSMRAYVLAQPGAQQSYAALTARIGRAC